MNGGAEQELIDELFGGLKGTFLEGQLILGGSSGLFAFPTSAPAYTEDLDFYISEELVVNRGVEIVKLLAELGYKRQPETPTFSAPGRPSLDLVGYSTTILSLEKDPTFRDHGAERYASFLEGLEAGYRALIEIVKELLSG